MERDLVPLARPQAPHHRVTQYMKLSETIFSATWCVIWAIFAAYCALSARGSVDLRNPMGPSFIPRPQAGHGKFAFLGDCHSHRRSLREFLRLAPMRGVEFGIQLGDFVDYDEDIAYHHFVDRVGEQPFPLFVARGNHEAIDFDFNETNRYQSHIPRTSFFIIHAGVLLGVVDNASGDFADNCLEEARDQIASFRQKHQDAPVVLAMHMPPTIDGTRSTDLSASATRAVLDLCTEFRVDYLVCGHVHDHIEIDHGSTTVLIDGCGGGSLQAPSTEVHYLEFSANQGALSFESVPLPRDHPVLAKADYLLHVSVPRYRWWFFLGACAILLREGCSLRRAHHSRVLASTRSSANGQESQQIKG